MKKIRLLTEADVTAESAFFMQRRQVLKALGIRHQRGRLILTLNGAGRSLQLV